MLAKAKLSLAAKGRIKNIWKVNGAIERHQGLKHRIVRENGR